MLIPVKTMNNVKAKRCLLPIFLFSGILALLLNITNSSTQNDPEKFQSSDMKSFQSSSIDGPPIILWWADLLREPGAVRHCSNNSCFITNNRSYVHHPNTKAIMFYGSTLELNDLPVPRKPNHKWAIIHEESPKNNWAFSNEDLMRFFTYTATFRRSSDFPLTLMWLTSIEDIESTKYYHSFEEKERYIKELSLAPVAYIQTDCDAPSDRDRLVELLSMHIPVDSLGKCLNNKKLPQHLSNNLQGMDHSDFYELLSKYKFVIAAENAICEDYITEKFWRSFYVGTVPIVFGSPTIKDWLPTPGSALVVQDYSSVDLLVKAITDLSNNNTAYSNAVSYKTSGVSNKYLLDQVKSRTWGLGPENVNFADAFQCYVCESISTNLELVSTPRVNRGLQCPKPSEFMKDVLPQREKEFWWPSNYMLNYKEGAQVAAAIINQ